MLAVVIIVGSGVASVGGLLLVRRLLKVQTLLPHNEIVGLMFATVALLYSVLLAFVVFAVYQRFSDASKSVTDEAAATVVAFRDTQQFPEPYRSEAQSAFRAYVNEVVASEWASHGKVLPHKSRDALDPVWNAYRKFQPVQSLDQARYTSASDRLSALELQRHLRHLAGEASLPNVIWALIVGGGVVTVAMSYLFLVERTRVHALLVALLGGFVAGVLVLIFSLNFPFTGQVHVSRSPFRHALQEFTALNLQAGPPGAQAGVPPRTTTVVVDAKKAWNDTGVDIGSGDRVSVSATGTIFNNGTSSNGPDGVAESRDLRQFNVINEDNHGALIGKVGDGGTPFAVGSDFSSGDLPTGRFFLGVNDKGVDNNAGAFSALVTVRRP